MSFPTTNDTVSSSATVATLPNAGSDLLRLVRSGSEPQSWSLPLGRCTLGSSRQCHVYLPDDRVRPLHCLIVHNADETLVTRWASGALLNGEDFSTAPFEPGDQLTIGNIELQLVADDTQTLPADQQGAAPTAPTREVAPTPPPSVEPERHVSPPQPAAMPTGKSAEDSASVVPPQWQRDRTVRRLWLANFNARGRCRQLIGSMRALRSQSSGFDQQLDALRRQLHCALDERQQLAGELEQRQAEMVERDQQATAEMDRLISELSTACERANASESAVSEQALAGERLREEIATLASQYEQLELAQAQDEQNRILLSQELADRDLKIDGLQRQLEQSGEAGNANATRSAELADRVEKLQADLDRERTERRELAAEQAALGNQLRELEKNLADREQTIGDLRQQLEQAQESARQIDEKSSDHVATVANLHLELKQKDAQRLHLEASQSAFTQQRQDLVECLDERGREIEDLQRQLLEANQAANVDRKGEAAYTDTIEALQAELNQQQADREKVVVADENVGNRLKELENALAEREHQLRELRQEHEDVCQTLHSLEQGSFEQVDACKRLEEELAGLRTEREELPAVQSGHDGQLRALEEDLTERDRTIEELNEQLSAVTQHRVEMESEIAQHAETYRRLEIEAEELRERCQTLTGEQTGSRSQQQELQQSIAGYEEQIATLMAKLESVRQEHQAQQKAAEGQVDSREGLIAELAELRELHEEVTQQYEAEFERRQTADQEVAQREHRIEMLEIDLRGAQTENKQFSEKLALSEQARAMAEEPLTQLREEVETLTASQNSSSEEDIQVRQQRDELAMELDTARQELLQLQQQAETVSSEASAHVEQLVALEQAKAVLEERLTTEQGQTSALSSKLDQACDQLHKDQLQLQQSESLYQESQNELAAAKECLLAAEQALQNASTKDATPTAGLEDLRELSVWSDKDKPSALEDDNQAAEAETSAFQPTSFIDQHSHMFDEDAPVESPGESAGPATPDSSISVGSQENSGDAALEEYMGSMMRRVRGDSDSSSAYVTPPRATPSNQPTASAAKASPQGSLGLETQAEAEIVEPLDLNSLKNASKKPPLPTDMRAMRELANSSARRAISKYSRRRHLEAGFSAFLISGISSGVAAYMMHIAESFQSPLFLGGLIPALVGLIWGVKLLGVLLESIREGSGVKSKPAEIMINEAPLPIDGFDDLDR